MSGPLPLPSRKACEEVAVYLEASAAMSEARGSVEMASAVLGVARHLRDVMELKEVMK